MNQDCAPRRKKPPPFTGLRERFSQLWVRIRQLEGNPHDIAMGMATGIFIAITPIVPLQTIVAVALAFVVRGSKSAALLGSWLSNPLTIPLIYYADYQVGCVLLGYEAALDEVAFDSFSGLMALGMEVAWAMMVGSLVVGAGVGALAYVITFRAFAALRRKQTVEPGAGKGAQC